MTLDFVAGRLFCLGNSHFRGHVLLKSLEIERGCHRKVFLVSELHKSLGNLGSNDETIRFASRKTQVVNCVVVLVYLIVIAILKFQVSAFSSIKP